MVSAERGEKREGGGRGEREGKGGGREREEGGREEERECKYSGPILTKIAWDQHLFRLLKFQISETVHFESIDNLFLFNAHQNNYCITGYLAERACAKPTIKS